MPDQIQIINKFAFLPFEGPIDLRNPEVIFTYFEDWSLLKNRSGPESLQKAHFGVLVSRHSQGFLDVRDFTQNTKAGIGNRDAIKLFDLKKREYLGTTSMDPELSLIMANQALIKPGSLVLDPFVGTGSFLITSAHFGAYVMGADIDGRQIRGKSSFLPPLSEKEPANPIVARKRAHQKRDVLKIKENNYKSVYANIEQYGISSRLIDNVVCDLAHHPWRRTEIWDAIICDPPYGIRAGAKKIGLKENVIACAPDNIIKANGDPKYPATVPYEMDDVIIDLLEFANTYLTIGGRLVYWLPTIPDEYTPNDLPNHPNLKLIANSQQVFGKWSRRLVTMEKIALTHTVNEFDLRAIQDSRRRPAHNSLRERYFGKYNNEK